MRPTVGEVASMVSRVLTEQLTGAPKCGPPETAHIGNEFIREQGEKLRLSYGSDCKRRQFYSHYEGDKAVKKDGFTRLAAFSGGHVWEAVGLELLREGLKGTEYGLYEPLVQAEVELDGIVGHPDGALTWQGKPAVILDFKNTSEFQFKAWDDDRIPDSMWGYPQQGGLYTLALEEQFPCNGFIWPCMIKPDRANGYTPRVEVGWMTRDEALGYGRNALSLLADVRDKGGAVPPPRHHNYPKAPCGSGKKAYCPFFEWCKPDCR